MNQKRGLLIILLLVSSALPLLTTIPMAEASELVVSISHSYDDVWMTEAGNIFSNTFMVMMLDNEIGIHSFLRFQDLEISKTAKINYATLKVYVAETQETPDPGSSVTIYGIDEADCTPFTSDGSLWSLSRAYTSASVNWDTSEWAGYKSVNVTDIVKEIINQYAWEFGNDLGLQILGASDSGHWPRSFEDYYHAYHEGQAQLTIVYDVIDEEDPPEDEYDFIEQHGEYSIWRRNGTGGVYFKDIVVLGSPDGALEDYYIPIRTNSISPFADNGKHEPLYFSNIPSAVYHNGVTYIVWQGDAGYDPYIIAFNHSTDTFSDPVKVGNNPLTGSDSHGGPVVLVDNQSYIHVFYGAHQSNLKYTKSDNPEDITAWTAQPDPTTGCTYPHVIPDNGTIYLTYRNQPNMGRAYRISNDNGATWGAENEIIGVSHASDSIYCAYTLLDGTKIHMIWRYWDASITKTENLYHAYLELSDGHMYSMDGTDLGTSITRAESNANCLVVDSGAFNMFHHTMQLDENGYPVIIYCVVTAGAQDYGFIRWTGANWIDPVILMETDSPLNSMALIVYTSTNMTAFLVAPGEAGRGGDIERWTLSGTTWIEGETILSEDATGKGLEDPKIVFNFDDELKLIFTEHDGVGAGNLNLYASNGITLLQAEPDSGRLVFLPGCKNDFGDIRFTNYNGASQIEHWLEEKEDNSYALYWVKVPEIPASPGNVTIRVYWGDLEVSSASTEAREDFTTYTEVEEIDDIQKTSYHVDFLDTRARTTYLYRNYTTDFFGNFSEHMNVKRISHGADSTVKFIMKADVIGGSKELVDNTDEHIYASFGGTLPYIYLVEVDGAGATHWSTPQKTPQISLGTWYYVAFNKYGDELTLDTYTTANLRHAGEDGDFCSQNLTLQVDYTLAISYVGNTYDDALVKAGASDFESQFLRDYVENEPSIGEWGNLTSDGSDDVYFVLDDNGTLVDLCANATTLQEILDCLDTEDPDIGDPDPPGWETEGPFTRFKMRLYFLFIGLACLFTPLWAMGYKKFDAVGYTWCFLIMVLGVGLLWSITGI